MDVFSHTLWANIIWRGNIGTVGLASVLPDLPDGINWFYRLVTKRGSFGKLAMILSALFWDTKNMLPSTEK